MPTQSLPNINGNVCSWADIGVSLSIPEGASVDLFDFNAIKWSDKVEVGEQFGASGGRLMGTTAGKLSTESSITLTRKGALQFIEALAVAARAAGLVRGDQVAISNIRFDILIQHEPMGSTDILEAKLFGCRFLSRSHDLKEGNEADMVEVELKPMYAAEKSAVGDWIVLL
jgi:hypothetical protein